MRSIRVQNLRSLKDTGAITIRKMNILVGNNSSGKSTFLRIFPLLKQSLNKKINGPVLWCGDDDDYVDFGSFDEALNNTSDEGRIDIEFDLNINLEENSFEYGYFRKQTKPENVRVGFSIENCKNTGYDFISVFRYVYREYRITVNFTEKNEIKKFYINDKEVNLEVESTKNRFYPFYYDQFLFDIPLFSIRGNAVIELKKLFNIGKDDDEYQRLFDTYLSYIYFSKILKQKVDLKGKNKEKKDIEKLFQSCSEQEIVQWVFLYYLPSHFASISNYIKLCFRNVYYIAPVRATAERYYRLRNAAVKEVDCRGKNLPVFLNSLTSKSFTQFQHWTKENLGFEVVKTTSEGHVSLKIKKDGQDKAINLSDTGFGYSQILPIVTQLWYIAKQVEEAEGLPFRVDDYDIPTIIVIEQPELHLHPGLQAKLIDIMAKVANQGKVNFIIETHSETMINRMGHVIAKGGMDKDDVGIIIFEKESDDANTVVKQGGYDEEGYLENWPVGFFEP